MTLGEKIISTCAKSAACRRRSWRSRWACRGRRSSKWETNEATPDTAKGGRAGGVFRGHDRTVLLRDIEPQSDPSPSPGGVPSVAEMLRGAAYAAESDDRAAIFSAQR